jgi:hypothetical protein
MSKLYILTGEIQFKNVILKSFEYFINEASMLKHNASGYLAGLIYYAGKAKVNVIVGRYNDKAVIDFYSLYEKLNTVDKLKTVFNSFNIFIDAGSKEIIDIYSGFAGYQKGDALILEEIRNAISEYGRVKKPLIFMCGDKSCSTKIL